MISGVKKLYTGKEYATRLSYIKFLILLDTAMSFSLFGKSGSTDIESNYEQLKKDMKFLDKKVFEKDVYKKALSENDIKVVDKEGQDLKSTDFFFIYECAFFDAVENFSSHKSKKEFLDITDESFIGFTKLFKKVVLGIYKEVFVSPNLKQIHNQIKNIDMVAMTEEKFSENRFVAFCVHYFVNCIFNFKKHKAKGGILKKFVGLRDLNTEYKNRLDVDENVKYKNEDVDMYDVVFESIGYIVNMIRLTTQKKK